jgi:hypothetical protein
MLCFGQTPALDESVDRMQRCDAHDGFLHHLEPGGARVGHPLRNQQPRAIQQKDVDLIALPSPGPGDLEIAPCILVERVVNPNPPVILRNWGVLFGFTFQTTSIWRFAAVRSL